VKRSGAREFGIRRLLERCRGGWALQGGVLKGFNKSGRRCFLSSKNRWLGKK
jgi:hypothetical protein